MKKITLSVGLIATMLSSNAQDTLCTYFTGKRVLEFNYYTNEILYEKEHNSKYYEIKLKYGDILCLDLSDDRRRVRKVITTFWNGETCTQTLNSKGFVYYSQIGAVKVLVSKPRIKLFTK